MQKYFLLQLKRMAKTLPFVLLITILLFAGLLAVFQGLMQQREESDDLQKFTIGVVGDTDNAYMDFGLSAVSSFDEMRFSVELETFQTEDDALRALKSRRLSAYFVFPDGFIDAALYGEIKTIRVVSMESAGNFVALFKQEIANTVSEILVESQKGVYGVDGALDDNGYADISYKMLNAMFVEYIDFVLHRADVFSLDLLGIADRLTLPAYYFCSFTVFLLLLMGLPYAGIFVKKDLSLQRMLTAAGVPPWRQVISECAAYTGIMAAMFAGILLLLGILAQQVEILSQIGLFHLHSPLLLALLLLPIVFLTSTFGELLFELSENLVNGILLQFFLSLALCYLTGCFFPLYTFPAAVQTVAPYLPTGAARAYFAALLTGEDPWIPLLTVLLYAAAFFALTVAVRGRKLSSR